MDDKNAASFAYAHTPSVSGTAGGSVARIARSGLHAGFYSRSRPQLGGHLLVCTQSSEHAALASGERTNLRSRSSSIIFCNVSLSVMRLPRLDRNPCDNRSVHRRGLCNARTRLVALRRTTPISLIRTVRPVIMKDRECLRPRGSTKSKQERVGARWPPCECS